MCRHHLSPTQSMQKRNPVLLPEPVHCDPGQAGKWSITECCSLIKILGLLDICWHLSAVSSSCQLLFINLLHLSELLLTLVCCQMLYSVTKPCDWISYLILLGLIQTCALKISVYAALLQQIRTCCGKCNVFTTWWGSLIESFKSWSLSVSSCIT